MSKYDQLNKGSKAFNDDSSSLMRPDNPLGGQAPGRVTPHAEDLLAMAESISSSRTRRKHFLAADLFGEPAWEMLLALYRADVMGYRMTVSNLCRASDAPSTTALRWIERLEELGMVMRRKNPLDQRVVFIEFTAETRDQMQNYLSETWKKLFVSA